VPITRSAFSATARGLKAFLNLEAGIVRADVPSPPESRQTERGKQGELERLRALLATKERQIATLCAAKNGVGVRPENLIWIFGTGRSGNTWLSSMMGDLQGHDTWREPGVGMLFGGFYFVSSLERQRKTNNFILGEGYREIWLGSIRNFVLDGARSRFPDLGEDGYLTVKEQVGSVGAPLMMEALPESRMVLLVRDPRDVVASVLDASREGAWHYERRKNDPDWTSKTNEDPNAMTEERATRYLMQVGAGKDAYDAHGGPKVLIKYEDLRNDTLGTMKRLYSTLGVPVDEEELARAVHKHSWENIPEEKRGEGKFYRKATPGGWREDLTLEQAAAVEKITAPLLQEFYPVKS
jgi:hypothetical protein